MLHSRLRPGLNHMAFVVRSSDVMQDLLERAGDHGWSALPFERHPIAGGAKVAYLEDRDGFEVELVRHCRCTPRNGSSAAMYS